MKKTISIPARVLKMLAFKGITDLISFHKWDEIPHLVARVIRSVANKALISTADADHAEDIIASPDEFGFVFEN